MKVVFSFHVKERMLQRGINSETVKEIIKKPDFLEDSFNKRKIASKKLDKLWHVVFIEEEKKIIVISVYFD
jgi:hypothetical protein